MAWLNRVKREVAVEAATQPLGALPATLTDLLNSIDAEALVLAPGESIIYATPGVAPFNLTRDRFLLNNSLLTLVRAVRRSGLQQ